MRERACVCVRSAYRVWTLANVSLCVNVTLICVRARLLPCVVFPPILLRFRTSIPSLPSTQLYRRDPALPPPNHGSYQCPAVGHTHTNTNKHPSRRAHRHPRDAHRRPNKRAPPSQYRLAAAAAAAKAVRSVSSSAATRWADDAHATTTSGGSVHHHCPLFYNLGVRGIQNENIQ